MEIQRELTGDEMFKELGYEIEHIHYNCDNTDVYTYKDRIINDFIRFKTSNKSICTCFKTWFTYEELKAINKKCEELGWIE